MNPGRTPVVDLRTYPSGPIVVIDGVLQVEEQRVDLRWGPHGPRLYVRWAVPNAGLEFDGSTSVGTDRTHRVTVMAASGSQLLNGEMRVVHFALGRLGPNSLQCARAIFVRDPPREPETLRPPPEPTGKPDPFGYEREVRKRVFFGSPDADPFGYSLDGRRDPVTQGGR